MCCFDLVDYCVEFVVVCEFDVVFVCMCVVCEYVLVWVCF